MRKGKKKKRYHFFPARGSKEFYRHDFWALTCHFKSKKKEQLPKKAASFFLSLLSGIYITESNGVEEDKI